MKPLHLMQLPTKWAQRVKFAPTMINSKIEVPKTATDDFPSPWPDDHDHGQFPLTTFSQHPRGSERSSRVLGEGARLLVDRDRGRADHYRRRLEPRLLRGRGLVPWSRETHRSACSKKYPKYQFLIENQLPPHPILPPPDDIEPEF